MAEEEVEGGGEKMRGGGETGGRPQGGVEKDEEGRRSRTWSILSATPWFIPSGRTTG